MRHAVILAGGSGVRFWPVSRKNRPKQFLPLGGERSLLRETFERLGSPEGELAIAQAVVFMACAAKSNAVYVAFGAAMEDAKKLGTLDVPLRLRNAPTGLMKGLGYGRGYQYAHDFKDAYTPQDYLPEKLQGRVFYHPSDRGYEKTVKDRLDRWRQLRRKADDGDPR